MLGRNVLLEQLLTPRHLVTMRAVKRDLLVLFVDVIREGAFESESLVAVFALERLGARVEVLVVNQIVAMTEHLGAIPTAERLRSIQRLKKK